MDMRDAKFHTYKLIVFIASASALLNGCGNGNNGASTHHSSQNMAASMLKINTSSQYPIITSHHLANTYVTVNNISSKDITGIKYTITGNVDATIPSPEKCTNLSAHALCTLPIKIKNSHSATQGSLTVTAQIPNIQKTTSTISSSNTANNIVSSTLGLVPVSLNHQSGANGVTILYPTAVIANKENTVVTVTAIVNSKTAGAFNTINLTTKNGTLLNFTPISGNSGYHLTNLTNDSIVTFNLMIPEKATHSTFYIQTMKNGKVINQGTKPYTITVIPHDQKVGILKASPSLITLTAKKPEQTIIYTNTGNTQITQLSPNVPQQFTIKNNTCKNTLASLASCKLTVSFDPNSVNSGGDSIVTRYNSGTSQLATNIAQVIYTGDTPHYGLTVTSSDNPSLVFNTTTKSPTLTSEITLKNTSTATTNNNLLIQLPNDFSLSETGTNNSCHLLSNNILSNSIKPQHSCDLLLTYNNTNPTTITHAPISITYDYNQEEVAKSQTFVSYSTVNPAAALSISSANNYNFGNIIVNGSNNIKHTFTITNTSSDTAAINIKPKIISSANKLFSITNNTCKSSLASEKSCHLTVQFGPTAHILHHISGKLQLSYNSPNVNKEVTLTTRLSGLTLQKDRANIQAKIRTSGFKSGDGSSPHLALQIKQGQTGSIAIIYTNFGQGTAHNFTTITKNLSSAWQITSHGCNAISLTRHASCTDSYSITPNTAGMHSFNYNDIDISWQDKYGRIDQHIIPKTQKQQSASIKTKQASPFATYARSTYINASRPPELVYSYSGLTTNNTVVHGGQINITATLQNGMGLDDQKVIPTTNLPGASFNPSVCYLSSEEPSCNIKMYIPSNSTIGSYNLSFSSTPNYHVFNMNRVLNFTVGNSAYILMTNNKGDISHYYYSQCTIGALGIESSSCVNNKLFKNGLEFSSNIGQLFGSMTIYQNHAYITNPTSQQYINCPITASGSIDHNSCSMHNIAAYTTYPSEISFHSGYAYITGNKFGEQFQLVRCDINSDGIIDNTCTTVQHGLPDSSTIFRFTVSNDQYAYFVDYSKSTYQQCSISGTADTAGGLPIEFSTCTPKHPLPQYSLLYPLGLVFSNQYAYLVNTGSAANQNFLQCGVDHSGRIILETCETKTPSGSGSMSKAHGLTIYNNYAYFSQDWYGGYTQCGVDASTGEIQVPTCNTVTLLPNSHNYPTPINIATW